MHWKHLSDTREMRPAYECAATWAATQPSRGAVYRSTRRNFVRKRALRLTLGAVAGLGAIALFPTIANAQEPDPVTVLGQQVNMLWVVIGAVLVIFMQAGFALVETGFCRAKHAAHVVSARTSPSSASASSASSSSASRFAFGGFDVRRLRSASTRRSASALIGSGNWVFLWQGRLGAVAAAAIDAGAARLLPLHGGLHGHRGHDPDRGDGRAVEVEAAS